MELGLLGELRFAADQALAEAEREEAHGHRRAKTRAADGLPGMRNLVAHRRAGESPMAARHLSSVWHLVVRLTARQPSPEYRCSRSLRPDDPAASPSQ